MNRLLICVLLVLLISLQARADGSRHEGNSGSLQLTDAPTEDRFKVFTQPAEKQNTETPHTIPTSKIKPIPGEYLFSNVSASDGSVWAVRITDARNQYYWYMGAMGKTLAKVKGKKVYADGGYIFYIKDNDVVMSDGINETMLPRNTLGYSCYTKTMLHALKTVH